jgi:hypothetical protein
VSKGRNGPLTSRPSLVTGLLAVASLVLWWLSAIPGQDFTAVLRGHGSAPIAKIVHFEQFFYVFVALGCALLFLMRARHELTLVLIGGAIGSVYPLFAVYWTLQYNWQLEQYYRRTQPYHSSWGFLASLLTTLIVGASAGGVAGMFRWISLDPDNTRVVSVVRLSLRALLLWLGTLPAVFLIQQAFGFRFTTLPDIRILGPGGLLLAWTAGVTWARSKRPRIYLPAVSAMVLVLLSSNVGLPFSFVVAWLLWNLCMLAVAGPRVLDPPVGRRSAVDWGVLVLSAPALILPLLVFTPVVGPLLVLLTAGSVYVVSWAAVVLALLNIASRAPAGTKLTNLFLASGSLWFGYRLLEQSRHFF